MAPTRRDLLRLAAGLLAPVSPAPARAQGGSFSAAGPALAALEAKAGGRLGVCLLDTASGRLVGYRVDQRFALCSTFKLPLAAIVLREADQGRLRLDEVLPITKADLVPFAPVTAAKLGQGMTIAALAEAAQVTSDNVAANLLLKRLGGPAAFTAALRGLGDTVTRLDNNEPTLNLVKAGEEHDTTTPRAMATTLARLLTGDALTVASRERLIGWMAATTTGSKRLRAGLPPAWRSGDKTGTGLAAEMTDKVNDIGMVWVPGRAPLAMAAFFDSARRSAETRDEDQAMLAEVGRIAAAWAAP
jgi:beta-lactamase class A